MNSNGITFGYARVSTIDQNLDRQLEALRKAGCVDKHIYQEKISGKNADRPELKELLGKLREDDTLIVTEMSRLARSTRDLLDITDRLKKDGINITFLKEQIDTTTPTGKLLFTVLASISEFERETIRQRQAEGIAIAKQQGRHLGRPKLEKPQNYDDVLNRWKDKEITAVEAWTEMGISKASFYRLLKNE